ncbi:hypothetical protein C2E23DRAFT_882430 [Lenzites betulinus]|nr:hypothetical protein C2E23DRAFT_882430 [Lenzites betulinus]
MDIPGELVVQSIYTNRILASAAFALLYYDFVLTIPKAIERYWSGKLSLVSVLFFFNRYLAVFGHIPVLVNFFGVFPEPLYVPPMVLKYHRFLSTAIQGICAGLMLLRTYALYGRDRRVLALLLILILAGAVISIWLLVAGRHPDRPGSTYADQTAQIGCNLVLSQAEGYDLALAWSAILAFDATVFVLTLLQGLRLGRMWSGGYVAIILRDGTLYFATLFVCYLANILAYALAQPVYKGVSTSIANVLSTTLVTRLMLNIRDPDIFEQSRHWGTTDIDFY